MGMQVPYSIYAQVQKKNNILRVEKRYPTDNKRFMQMERSRDNRGKDGCDAVF